MFIGYSASTDTVSVSINIWYTLKQTEITKALAANFSQHGGGGMENICFRDGTKKLVLLYIL